MVAADILMIVSGAVLLIVGASGVVVGGSALARRIGISPLWVGLTIVALGTSSPELVVSVVASWQGAGGVALGNVVGSNILNVLVVLGITALAAPVRVERVTLRRDILLLVGVSVGVLALSADGLLHWAEGALLVAAVIPYTVRVYRQEKRGWAPVRAPPTNIEKRPAWIQVAVTVGALAAVVLGGHFLVAGGTGIATTLGVPDRIIGLTVIAIGTSLPELATSLMAVAKRQVDLAIGNLIGSNLLNLLLVLGTAVLVRPIEADPILVRFDMVFMVLVSLLLFRFAFTGERVTRVEGAFLVATYLFYIGLLLGLAVG